MRQNHTHSQNTGWWAVSRKYKSPKVGPPADPETGKKVTSSPQLSEAQASQICDSLPWVYKVYVSAAGRSDAQDGIDRLSLVSKEHLRTRLKYLAETKVLEWKRPHAAKLKGVSDIYEVRFCSDKKQYRPLGFFGPDANEFTVLVIAIEKGAKYDPHSAIDTADTRRKNLLKGEGASVRLKIDGEDFESNEDS